MRQHPVSAHCRDCNTLHSLPSEQAVVYCNELMAQLHESGQLDFDLPEEKRDPELSTSFLYSTTGGKMFGVLVCEDRNGDEVILKAFSGKYNNRRTIAGWAPHLFDELLFNAVIEEGNSLIHPLTDRIASIEKGSGEWKELNKERKRISNHILEKLYALYEVRNFNNEQRSLSEAFLYAKSIPTGTGDCCAPKLLSYAAIHGLKPLSLAEFFLGASSGTKTAGSFYPPCEDKCLPLLGFMLCHGTSADPSVAKS